MFGDENEYSVSSVNSTSALNLAFQGHIQENFGFPLENNVLTFAIRSFKT